MMIMEIIEEKESLVLYDDTNCPIGEISWESTARVLIVDHTFVEPAYNGRGYAKKLVEALVAKARAENWQLLPTCPYAKKVLSAEEYTDILRK